MASLINALRSPTVSTPQYFFKLPAFFRFLPQLQKHTNTEKAKKIGPDSSLARLEKKSSSSRAKGGSNSTRTKNFSSTHILLSKTNLARLEKLESSRAKLGSNSARAENFGSNPALVFTLPERSQAGSQDPSNALKTTFYLVFDQI